MGLRGDFGKLRGLTAGVRQVADKRFRDDVNRNLGQEAHRLVVESFEKSVDPYGRRWKPSRGRKGETRGTGQILRDTGRLLNSLNVRTRRDGFAIVTNVQYARRHNYGGLRTPQRQFIPDSFNIGRKWLSAFQSVVDELLRERVGGK